ncbi:CheF family chemotaxis protein [Palaeococcus ferrophilus]|uniref:CheF family chemotaxis protein n=1 Tax=Palaeococcus ferrophilus TaxID=83868 RepID=UPI00064E8A04|nr:CheF family chemotaxis protein [Palaeococcus ferrophilus]
MPIAQVRVKAAVQSTWKGSTSVRWKEGLAYIEHDRIGVKYLRMGEVVGEDTFPFSALADLSIKVPDELKSDPELPHFGLKFYLPSGEKTLILTIGKNMLIYDEDAFKKFVHKIFEVLINGASVKLLLARMRGGALNMEAKWESGTLKIVVVRSVRKRRKERNIIVLVEGRPVSLFADMEDLDVEEIEMGDKKVEAWKIKHFYENESVVSYLLVEEKKVRLYILRYLLTYRKDYLELLMKVAEEFPTIKSEFQEELERELKELGGLDEMEQQVLMALYSGMDPLSLNEMFGISEKELEEIYDRLMDKGLLKLVMIRKVVDLTRDGRKLVNKMMKYGMGMM